MIKNTLPETDLTLSDFDYDLPESQIAQTPLEPRDSSRLMIIDRTSDHVEHRIFRDIVDYLRPGDTLVINDTRVIPARIIGHRAKKMMPDGTLADTESTAPVELLLLKQRENDVWEALAGPGKRAKVGDILAFGDGFLTAEVEDIIEGGCRVVRFRVDRAVCETVYEALHKLGSMPLPPYITEHLENPERYQTVYARHEGSAAAPTAGLHFTPELMDRIRDMGCAIVPVYICVTEESARIINERRAAGGRIIAIGTTSCRVLESAADENGILHPVSADTGIFIYPGYRFKIVDALLTNFHLPKSTLLMLVSALGGRKRMLSAYRTAVAEKYRFFSFGDAMLIQ